MGKVQRLQKVSPFLCLSSSSCPFINIMLLSCLFLQTRFCYIFHHNENILFQPIGKNPHQILLIQPLNDSSESFKLGDEFGH